MNTCATCKHYKVAHIVGPVEIWVCELARIGENAYRDPTDTCEEHEPKDAK